MKNIWHNGNITVDNIINVADVMQLRPLPSHLDARREDVAVVDPAPGPVSFQLAICSVARLTAAVFVANSASFLDRLLTDDGDSSTG